MDQRVCYRCLIREIAEKDYKEKIGKYIDAIAPNEKVTSEKYEERLRICKECDLLMDGTCNACGCYVELRAAGIKSECPHKHW